ncbi:MAG TPA: CaiB/BaiF CoA-transferase family protein [Xanthobacteraceae bacterium]|nr:CaiB/BaiF CoA-transferase family protein [Xanthobacteraceae bacterium]
MARYFLVGTYDGATHRLTMRPGEWVSQPSGYVAVGFTATLEPAGERLTGIVAFSGCSTLALQKVATAPADGDDPAKPAGQKVEVSLYESSLAMLVNVAANVLVAGKGGGRFGNGHPSIVPYTTYAAADAMMALAIGNDTQFAKAAAVLGHPEWANDERFASNRARVANRELIDGLIGAALATDEVDAWLDKLKAVGVPCGRINTVAQALAEPHTQARRMVETVAHPTIGDLKMLGIPFKFSDTPAAVRRPPPLLGEHTDEVLAELGMDPGAIAKLRGDKVV